MTSLSLLFWIVLGILVKLTVYLGMGFWRHCRDYKTLLMKEQRYNLNLGQEKPSWAEKITKNTLLSFQTFRVNYKVAELPNQSICSLYLVLAFEDLGVKDHFIHSEAFGSASIKRRNLIKDEPNNSGAIDIVVTSRVSGIFLKLLPFATNFLEFAEANGVALYLSCRSGSFGNCQTRLRSGEVSYRCSPILCLYTQ